MNPSPADRYAIGSLLERCEQYVTRHGGRVLHFCPFWKRPLFQIIPCMVTVSDFSMTSLFVFLQKTALPSVPSTTDYRMPCMSVFPEY
ncbi:hypothetical protein Y032_0051g2115 [Ancylostoma ceylanicum]|uniref:Uncharacterized protein n=1 Tax=Ancylostoma ceylanicum TaxID=53326 RepID=A0A016U8L5_9BILA|nr:hypothetical protein Y032_0051g2115 [Ancylostoma ceylanicum]